MVTRAGHGLRAIAGPDALELRTPVPMREESSNTVAEFTVSEGEIVPFTLTRIHPMKMSQPPNVRCRCWLIPRRGGENGRRDARSREGGASWRCGIAARGAGGNAHRDAVRRELLRRVKRRQGGRMILRWTAAGVLEAERHVRKVTGYRAIPKLLTALRAHDAVLDRPWGAGFMPLW